jgi:hypothetical protein
MTTPEWIQAGFRVGSFVVLLILLPQAVGFVLLRRWWTRGWTVRIIVAFLPLVVSFLISLVYWNVVATRISEAGGYACGMLGGVAWWTTQMVLVLNLAIGFAVLLLMRVRRRTDNSRRQQAAC